MDDGFAAVDVHVDIGNRVVFKSKIFTDSTSLFHDVVTEALEEHARAVVDPNQSASAFDDDEDPFKRETLILLGRVVSIKCIGVRQSAELFKHLQKSNVPLKMLDSIETPVFRTGITVKLGKIVHEATQTKPKKNPFDVMMAQGKPEAAKFIDSPPLQHDSHLDVQLQIKLFDHIRDVIKLGYYNPEQKDVIVLNVGKIVSTLCMLEKHWRKIFHKDFPQLPQKYSNCELADVVTHCRRNASSAKSEKINVNLVVSHMTSLSSLEWKAFGLKAMKVQLATFKEQIAELRSVLVIKRDEMVGHNSVLGAPKPTSSLIKSLPSYVQLDDDCQECFACVPPSTKKKTNGGRPTTKTEFINRSIKELSDVLRYAEDYKVFHLKDEEMGIVNDAFIGEGGTVLLSPSDRTFYRRHFKTKTCEGLVGMCINIFGRNKTGSNDPSCLFVWKSPVMHGDLHAGNVMTAIEHCRQALPNKKSAESIRHFNNILCGIAKVPAKVRGALTDYLFNGELKVKGGVADEHCQFVQNVANGLPMDGSWIVDGRAFNSRGGKSINSTKFDEFWNECRR